MSIELTNIAAGIGGFVIHGRQAFNEVGWSVSGAGDINDDGFADIIIGTDSSEGGPQGESYVVFGKAGGFGAAIDLSDVVAGVGGFVVRGENINDRAGQSVSSAGDINGDGFDDLLIGAPQADGPADARDNAGGSYVVSGKAGGFGAAIDLTDVAAGTGGFVIHGQDAEDRSGISLSSAGDINGDGFDDLIIGADVADGPDNARTDAGDSYVVFGKAGAFGAAIDLNDIAAGAGGFAIHGQDGVGVGASGDLSGYSVSSVGDINGDGFDDLIIGAHGADGPANTRAQAGDSYLVFGKAGGFGAAIDLAAIAAGNGGFVIHGQAAGHQSGLSVSSAGDINSDGFSDLIVGGGGPSYLIFGKAGGFGAAVDLAAVAAGNGGFVMDGSGHSVSSAGDVNGDGFDDLIIGAPQGDALWSGNSYVVFGKAGGFSAAINLATIAAGHRGFVIHGEDENDRSGWSVSEAGDVDGDGFDDLIVGAPFADGPANGRSDAGGSYVIFGAATIDGSVNHVTHLGGAGAQTLTGDAAGNVMIGGRGDDVLVGNGGGDILRGGEGNDTLAIADSKFRRVVGGTGDDVLAFSGGISLSDTHFRRIEGVESIGLGNGATTLVLGVVASHAIEGHAADAFKIVIDGSAVTNATVFINGSQLSRGLDIDLSMDTVAVSLAGGTGSDRFVGGTGNDTFDGKGGADTMIGGFGDDTYVVREAGDVVAENTGGGTDQINSFITTGLVANVENLYLLGVDNVNGSGNALDNSLRGNAGNNVLDGKAGSDTMIGGLGDDVFVVDEHSDLVIESAGGGTDQINTFITEGLVSNVENLQLLGTTNISGFGNSLANEIVGNNGGNWLFGMLRNDMLTGRAGQDSFIFNTAPGTDNVDIIVDYSLIDDLIRLEDAVFADAGPVGTLAADAFHVGTAAADGSDRIIYDTATGTIFYDSDGDGATIATPFATITAGLALTNSDFYVM